MRSIRPETQTNAVFQRTQRSWFFNLHLQKANWNSRWSLSIDSGTRRKKSTLTSQSMVHIMSQNNGSIHWKPHVNRKTSKIIKSVTKALAQSTPAPNCSLINPSYMIVFSTSLFPAKKFIWCWFTFSWSTLNPIVYLDEARAFFQGRTWPPFLCSRQNAKSKVSLFNTGNPDLSCLECSTGLNSYARLVTLRGLASEVWSVVKCMTLLKCWCI